MACVDRAIHFADSLVLSFSVVLTCASRRSKPLHTSREVLLIIGSMTTCDAGDIYACIDVSLFRLYLEPIKAHLRSQNMAGSQIQCSVIGLSAEVRVLRAIAEKTTGMFLVLCFVCS